MCVFTFYICNEASQRENRLPMKDHWSRPSTRKHMWPRTCFWNSQKISRSPSDYLW